MLSFKKTLSLFLSIIMLISLFLSIDVNKVYALAPPYPEYESDGNGGATLVQYYGSGGDVILPEMVNLNGKMVPLTTLKYRSFYGRNDINSITISKNIKSIDSLGFETATNIKEFKVDENNEYFTTLDGALYTKDMSTIIRYPAGKD